MQMRLISTLHVSHDYAVLCELQLFPAYYPSANHPAYSHAPGSCKGQPCPSVETHLAANPCCYKDSIRGSSVLQLKQSTGEGLYDLLACTFKRPAHIRKAEAESKSGESRDRPRACTRACSYPASRVHPTHPGSDSGLTSFQIIPDSHRKQVLSHRTSTVFLLGLQQVRKYTNFNLHM